MQAFTAYFHQKIYSLRNENINEKRKQVKSGRGFSILYVC